MKIANPLYDHAFKYLMSNDKLAHKVLSVILDKEVLELELSQQEIVVEDEERRLPPQRRSRIEQFMTLFNQAWVQEHKFILDLEEVPEEFKDIAEYLQRPLQEEEIRKRLQAEEDVEALFALQEAEKEQLRMAVEEERRQKEEERRQKEESLKREEEARTQARENALKLARLLIKTGVSFEEEARETGLPLEEIRRLAE